MYNYKTKLVKVIDGDTIVLDVDLGFHITARETIRLLNVDAPETRTLDLVEKARGNKVKDLVSHVLTGASDIELMSKKQDKYGRWLGVVIVDGHNLNELVEKWSKE